MDLSIAIPTYNRCKVLKENVVALINIIGKNNLQNQVEICISDNHSTDKTVEILNGLKHNFPDINIVVSSNEENIGLTKNVFKALELSTRDYIMFLGDDDFIDENYLLEVLNTLKSKKAECIIPSYKNIDTLGQETGRSRDVGRKPAFYKAGFYNCFINSWRGHQLSGLVVPRSLIINKCREKKIENLYPQIYFISCACLCLGTYHCTEYPVLVTRPNQNNKNWGYGEDGLLSDVFDNYKKLDNINYIERVLLESKFLYCQYWRCAMYLKKGWRKFLKCLFNISESVNTSKVNKVFIWIEIPLFFVIQAIKLLIGGELVRTLRVKVDI